MEAEIHFHCPCGAVVEETLPVPEPNLMAERHSDSTTEYWENIICDACGKDFEAHISNTFWNVDIIVDGAVDLSFDARHTPDVDEIQWIIESTQQLEDFTKVMQDIIALVNINPPASSARTFYNMLFAQVVTAVEAYLSGLFIHCVLNSDELIRKLVESDPELANQKFSLKEIFTKWSSLKILVAKYLKDLIFHDLKKIKPMYSSVLNIEFGDIEWLFKAVLIRHDCVHRNGFDKEGKPSEITKESIVDLVTQCSKFVSKIDQEIKV